MIIWREATTDDIAAIVALMSDDPLGAKREGADLAPYLAGFAAMQAEGANFLFVGEREGAVIATYQLTFITGLSHQAARRAQIESVRVAASLRSSGIGALLLRDAESRARAAGCRVIQLTTTKSRARAQSFYLTHGYEPTHIGFKKSLG
jgi:ribosomal protein S18 acetylase RimI-like enzyme